MFAEVSGGSRTIIRGPKGRLMSAVHTHPTRLRGPRSLAATLALVLAVATAGAQTRIEPPKNKYTPEQDVQLGQEAAAEVRKQYPIIDDRDVVSYLDELGDRLVDHAPAQFHHPQFEYSFTPVNLKEINAFALPGGPMFVNRGMIEAAQTEGEVAGVMAHELAHVLLRHGTANATKAQGFQLGALAGAIAGAVVGGGWGELISQGSQFGLGTWLMKYSREYEKQADLLGAQIMARAGYDPRDLGRMFETIQRESRSGAPEWLSSHPNPGNRSEYIAREASMLQIGPRPSARDFRAVKEELDSLPPAKSMADLARSGGNTGDAAPASVGRIGGQVPAPATRYRGVRGGRLFQTVVPANWHEVASNSSVKYVPENAYGQVRGETVFTHGVELGVARAASRDLSRATNALLEALARSNPDLRQIAQPRQVRLARRTGIAHLLANRAVTGGEEHVGVYTTMLADGNLFYVLTIVPREERGEYDRAFQRVLSQLRLND
jgi:Zn-dependent protease with chaperone function